ncbi:hypothetical protein PVL30_000102 [Lodderomyces elongisporus]|uniref:uncharacterized protein n=1 Tax=Lodderomyces elongisporus TaxID=36914 RepID=UPI00291D2485|nr:uncharacterized protein PVL30_000102 [Lodderomyces elongisporus]WLF76400.1 hypothetical protein PVL30_000102 [Lodderomyces elongisporus]
MRQLSNWQFQLPSFQNFSHITNADNFYPQTTPPLFYNYKDDIPMQIVLDKWYDSDPHCNGGHQIHSDLLYNKLIVDPFSNDFAEGMQWIGKVQWVYRCRFNISDISTIGSAMGTTVGSTMTATTQIQNSLGTVDDDTFTQNATLIFEGLDTIAHVTLNNESILDSHNAFHNHIVPVNLSQANELIIHFESSWSYGKEMENRHGKIPEDHCWNGDCSRLYVRKPQYQYGWDWGPKLLTCGPWKPVKLVVEEYLIENSIEDLIPAFIEDFFVNYELIDNDAKVWFLLRWLQPTKRKVTTTNIAAKIIVKLEHDVVLNKVLSIEEFDNTFGSNKANRNKSATVFTLQNVKLWYPYKLGKPTLYTIQLYFNDKLVSTQQVGFRKVELIQKPDTYGESFYFKINNIPVQMLGSNWIPPHYFHNKVNLTTYENLLELVVKSNQNMIRVWGGGQYENNEFYAKCDEMGIMVWQDFMFACGVYPNNPFFLESVQKEVEDQLIKLHHFASIVIFAGNNEDYQIADALQLDIHNSTQFPAGVIYETLIPDLVKEFCNQVVYRFGSPYSDTNHSSYDLSIGDSHQWEVWHGSRKPYQNWPELAARFISEFGMLAFPSEGLLAKYISFKELYLNSTILQYHNKAMNGAVNLEHYVLSNFDKPTDLKLSKWIYLTQLVQMEATSQAFRYWRRKWQDYEVGGVLVWQLNDCWPAISWSIIDFLGVPKLSYYGLKRELADSAISAYRHQSNSKTISKEAQSEEKRQIVLKNNKAFYKVETTLLDVWAFVCDDSDLTLEIQAFDANSGDHVLTYRKSNLSLVPHSVNELLVDQRFDWLGKDNKILCLRLIDNHGEVIARSSDWPQPLKLLKFTKLGKGLEISILEVSQDEGSRNGENCQVDIQLTTNKPVKGLELYIEGHNQCICDENGIDLFPNDPQIVSINGLCEEDVHKVKYRHLGDL